MAAQVGADEELSPLDKYSAALYWAVVTITSVGYGDICAKNAAEFRVATVCVLIRYPPPLGRGAFRGRFGREAHGVYHDGL